MKNIKKICSLIFLSTISLSPQDFNLITIQELLSQRSDIEYIKCYDREPFEYKPFPISQFPELQPNKGLLAETFILKIPNGQVCSWHGWIKVENNIIHDFIFHHRSLNTHLIFLNKTPFTNLKKINGKVAVITLEADTCYGHWIYNILGRLALLEKHGIEYDWLYVAYDKPYMKETLTMLGIDPNKIITPFNENHYIQADELIIPSHIGVRTPEQDQYRLNWIPLEFYAKKWNFNNPKIDGNTMASTYDSLPPSYVPINNYFFHSIPLCGVYLSQWLINYLQTKFLPFTQEKAYHFSEKVFISREKAFIRKIVNEDEIFSLFKAKGFKKYILEEMPFIEQIALFNQAKIIVAATGSSLINLVFCKPNTTIVEIFQARCEACFYYLSQQLKLDHHCIKTMNFCDAENIEGSESTSVKTSIIQNFIQENELLFNS